MRFLFSVVIVFASSTLVLAEATPEWTPPALAAIQDSQLVSAHRRAAAQQTDSKQQLPIPEDWIAQITEMVSRSSRRAGKPAEFFGLSFTKQGKIAHFLAVFPRDSKRTPNKAGTWLDISCAEYDQKDHQLVLSPATRQSGPDGFELFGIDQLSLICRELAPIVRLQHAFIANGLDYALEAGVIVADRGKHWAWEIGPDEEQMPNIIYSMIYQPITNEIRVVPIEDAKIAKKVEQAVKQARMTLKWAKRT